MGTQTTQTTQGGQAGSLGGLVAGLEKKVAANPENIEQQLLLARTYQELGERSKGLKLLRVLHQRNDKNMEVSVTLATLLLAGSDQQELQGAYQLLENAAQQKPEVAPMARLYQGDIQVKLGDTAQALKIWKSHLAQMPAGDAQRSLFKQRIAQYSGK
jgi:cytochrome c-type biogenesis protein CcmH